MNTVFHRARGFLREDDGPTATEYAVLIAVICIAALSTMAAFGNRVTAIYSAIDAAANAI